MGEIDRTKISIDKFVKLTKQQERERKISLALRRAREKTSDSPTKDTHPSARDEPKQNLDTLFKTLPKFGYQTYFISDNYHIVDKFKS